MEQRVAQLEKGGADLLQIIKMEGKCTPWASAYRNRRWPELPEQDPDYINLQAELANAKAHLARLRYVEDGGLPTAPTRFAERRARQPCQRRVHCDDNYEEQLWREHGWEAGD